MAAAAKSIFLALVCGVMLLGCASSGLNYPSTANIDTDTSSALSPAEQKSVIEDLQSDGSGSIPLLKGTTATTTQ